MGSPHVSSVYKMFNLPTIYFYLPNTFHINPNRRAALHTRKNSNVPDVYGLDTSAKTTAHENRLSRLC